MPAASAAVSASASEGEPSSTANEGGSPVATGQDPPACLDAELHFDASIGALLLVSCVDQFDPDSLELIWAWDGSSWSLVEDSGPAALVVPGVTYDSGRGVVVRYGGLPLTSNDCVSETWEWDGAWSAVEADAPTACDHMKLAYDSTRERTVLFGGQDAERAEQTSTWTWDGDAWQRVADDGPPFRAHFEFVDDAANERLLLWGGYDGSRVYDDFWSWDGATWAELDPVGPSARSHAGMAVGGDGILLFGGATSASTFDSLTDETWLLAGDAWEQLEGGAPSARGMPAVGYDSDRDVMVLYGGFDGQGAPLADTWEWDGTWRCVDGCD